MIDNSSRDKFCKAFFLLQSFVVEDFVFSFSCSTAVDVSLKREE